MIIPRVAVKRALKSGAGFAAAAVAPFVRPEASGSGCIFAYHRIADLGFLDPCLDDWNVPPRQFERQVLALLDCVDIVPLAQFLLCGKQKRDARKPRVALTFDDGYANFYQHVLPILERYQVPATVFVVTSLIGQTEPPPFDGWSVKNRERVHSDAWRPMTWGELERCVASGLVAVGGHSHRHLKAPECSREQFVEEAERSRAILNSRLGDVLAYAYPYGASRLGYVPPEYVNAVAAAGYRLAVTYDLGMVEPDTSPYRMPRIEAHAVDGPAAIRAKARGSLAPYRLTDLLRQSKRSV